MTAGFDFQWPNVRRLKHTRVPRAVGCLKGAA